MTLIVAENPLPVDCPACGARGVTWRAEVPSQTHLAVTVGCETCGTRFGMRYVNRRGDTRHEALAAIATEVVG